MTETSNIGKEPGGWELYRGIERVEKAVREMASSFVPLAVYNVTIQGLVSQISDIKTQHEELERKQEAAAAAKLKQDEEMRRMRAQQWFAIGTVVLASILGFASNIVLNVMNQGGSP